MQAIEFIRSGPTLQDSECSSVFELPDDDAGWAQRVACAHKSLVASFKQYVDALDEHENIVLFDKWFKVWDAVCDQLEPYLPKR